MGSIMEILEKFENLIYKILVWIVLIPKTLLQVVLHPDFASGYIKQELKPGKEGGGDSRFDEYFSPIVLLLIVALLPFVVYNFLPVPGVEITSPATENPSQRRSVDFEAHIKFISTSTDGFVTTYWRVEKEFFDEQNGYSYPVILQNRFTNNPAEINSIYYYNYSQVDSHTIRDFNNFQFSEAGNYWVVVNASKFDSNGNQIETYTSDIQIYIPPEDSQDNVSVKARTKPGVPQSLVQNITGQLQSEQTIFMALGLLLPPLLFALAIKLFSKEPPSEDNKEQSSKDKKERLSEDSMKETFYVQCYYFAPVALIFWATRYAVRFFTPDVFFRFDTDANLILLLPMLLALFWFVSVQTREISEQGKVSLGLAFLIVLVCMFILGLGILFVVFNDDPAVQDVIRKSSIWSYPLLAVGLLVTYQVLIIIGKRRANLAIPRWDKVMMGGIVFFVFISMCLVLAVGGRQASLTSLDFDATQQSHAVQAMDLLVTLEQQKFYTEEFDGILDNWSPPLMTSGDASQVTLAPENGNLNFKISQIEGQSPSAYIMNTAFLYTDVQVETAVVNKNDSANSVSLICRVSDNGWYEFEILNDGEYTIYAYDASNNTYNTLIPGGSSAIKTGLSENTYTAICQGDKLTLMVNGTLVADAVQDTTFNFTEGTIGLGVYSPNGLPVDVDFEYVKMSEPPPAALEIVDAPAATEAPAEALTEVPATEVPSPEPQPFSTEEFDTSDNWTSFAVDGNASRITTEDNPGLSIFAENSALTFDLNAQNLWVYATYDPFEYDNVRIDASVTNRGVNTNNVSLICRYTDTGWYEFNIGNDGLYTILVAEVDSDGYVNYNEMYSGGSTAIKSGNGTNEYTAICNGDTLSLYINGEETRVITETIYKLASGKIGVSVSSFDILPVAIDVDWVRISEP